MRILVACLVIALGYGLIHKLHIEDDDRHLFKIETFGFNKDGLMNISIIGFSYTESAEAKSLKKTNEILKVGLLMRRAKTETDALQNIEEFIEKQKCILDDEFRHKDDIFIDLSSKEKWKHTSYSHKFTESQVGLYSLMFARCHSIDTHSSSNYIRSVSFQVHASFANPGPNYLSAGDIPLPAVYMSFFFMFGICTVMWGYLLSLPVTSYGNVYSIHYMMLLLVGIKALSLLFESIRFHYITLVGASELWSIIYYIFATFKGIMLFLVILLIGSGWSLMKGYLHDKEKRIIFVVLLMQVINHVAMVILEETSPGSKSWLAWRDILHVVDILCCCFILFPIVWSIRHLRQASEVDGKIQHNVSKLKLFREFYIVVILYVYFTRIGIDVVEANLPYNLLWVGPCCNELITLVFFVYTGYQFKPSLYDTYDTVEEEEEVESKHSSHVNTGSHSSSSSSSNSSNHRKDVEMGSQATEESYAGHTEYGLQKSYSNHKVQKEIELK